MLASILGFSQTTTNINSQLFVETVPTGDATMEVMVMDVDNILQKMPRLTFLSGYVANTDLTAANTIFTPYLTLGSTNVQAVIMELKDEVNLLGGGLAFGDLSDVTITTPVVTHVAVYDGAGWVNRVLIHSDISNFATGVTDNETTHSDVLQDGDFLSEGIMRRSATTGIYSILPDNTGNWDTAFTWGDHGVEGYLTSFTELDTVYINDPAFGISAGQITNWDAAFLWGDHDLVGYLTTETDDQTAAEVTTVVTNFDNNLSASDTDVQTALETLDELITGSGVTNLAYDSATKVVSSDTGTDATLTVVDGVNDGLMIVADKTKLDGVSGSNTGDQDLSAYLPKSAGNGEGLTAALYIETSAGSNALDFTNNDGYIQGVGRIYGLADALPSIMFTATEFLTYKKLSPGTHDTYDLGTNIKRWQDLYAMSGSFTNTITASNLSGTNTGDQDLTPLETKLGRDETTAVAYTTLDADAGKTIITTHSSVILSDDVAITAGFDLNILNNSGGNITFSYGTDDADIGGAIPDLPDTKYAYIKYVGANEWSTIVGGDVGGSATTIASLDDTDITSPGNGQALTYNTTSSKWENTTLGAGVTQLDNLSDVTSAAVTDKFALMANGSGYVGRAIVEADISDLTHIPDTNLDIATSAEVNTGTDNVKAISPLALAGSQLQTDVTTNNAKTSNATHTGDVTGDVALTIAAASIDVAMIDNTGTPGPTTFYRGDGAWEVPSGGGNLSNTGTPVNNQVGVFTSATVLEGDDAFTWDSTTGALRIDGTATTDYFQFRTNQSSANGRAIFEIGNVGGSDVALWVMPDVDAANQFPSTLEMFTSRDNTSANTKRFGFTSFTDRAFIFSSAQGGSNAGEKIEMTTLGRTGATQLRLNTDGRLEIFADPSTADGVGDQGYNDLRYAAIADANATHTGDVTGSAALTIGADKILESHLKSVNAPTDEYVLTYEATTGDFEWQEAATGGAGDITEVNTTGPLQGGSITGAVNLTIDQANTSTDGYLSQTDWDIFNGKTSNTGTVTAVNNGNGMSFTNITGSGTVTLGTPTSVTGTSTNSVTTSSHTHAVTTAAVTNGGTALADGNNIYDFVIGLGYTSNAGTVTSVAGGTGTTSSGGTTPSISLNFAELTDMTGDIAAGTEFIIQNGAVESRKAASEIKLGTFSNDQNWSSATGTMSSWYVYVQGVNKEQITNGEHVDFRVGNGLSVVGTTVTNPDITYSLGTLSADWNSGSTYSITAAAFYEGSLRALKTNIQPFTQSALELVNSLDIVTYDKKDGEIENKIGIIIDDSPKEFANPDENAVDLYKTIFIQAKAIQELTDKLEALENRVKKLEDDKININDPTRMQLDKFIPATRN